MAVDLVLSSGFLAFAAQAGVLKAVEDVGIEVSGLCGTSSGALAGALWMAGMPADEILARLTATAPLRRVRPSWAPWRGVLSIEPVVAELRGDLPATFADLGRPFGVGVVDGARRPHLLCEGELAPAVAASCAIPGLFAPVDIGGTAWSDGGVADRTGLAAWRSRRPDVRLVLHLVDRSAGAEGDDDLDGVAVVRSPRSGAKLWSLGDVGARFERARQSARVVLEGL
ncbi:MAG: patatin-like phospholipase family protein [Alphaproteobacteria bacterium]|nr:patatin-like phospholipase family protein [Alphaproteobacteria bacterium]